MNILVNFYRGTFSVFRASRECGGFPEGIDAKFEDASVAFLEDGLVPRIGGRHAGFERVNIREGAIEVRLADGREVGERFLHAGNPVADHCEIVAGFDGEADGFCETEVIEDCAHVEIIRHDEAIESVVISQQSGDDRVGEGRGEALRFEGGVERVSDHHGIHAVAEGSEDVEFVGFEVFFGQIDHGEFMVRIERCAGISGEVFAAGEDPLVAQCVVEEAGIADDLCRGVPVAASAEGVIGLIVEGDVEDGAEVEVESEDPQEFAGDGSVLLDQGGVITVSELIGVWRFVADEFEARDASSFLIDGDDGGCAAEVFEIVDEFSQLGWRLDIASEEDEAAGLDAAE